MIIWKRQQKRFMHETEKYLFEYIYVLQTGNECNGALSGIFGKMPDGWCGGQYSGTGADNKGTWDESDCLCTM